MRPDDSTRFNLTTEEVERFWSLVERAGADECWHWRGSVNRLGYGVFRFRRPILAGMPDRCLAHRLAHHLAHGPFARGLCVCHSCDVPGCCNDAHLFEGTRADNNRDMLLKGRYRVVGNGRRGERHHSAKLTVALVREIRERYASGGVTLARLGAHYGVRSNMIWRIIHRRAWKDVE